MGLLKFAAPPDLIVTSSEDRVDTKKSPEKIELQAEMKGTQTGRMSGIDTHRSNVPKPASKITPTNEFAKAKITVPKPGNKQIVRNRVTGDSKAGRKLRAQNIPVVYTELSPEIQKWNAEVEARKAAKVLAKISRGKE